MHVNPSQSSSVAPDVLRDCVARIRTQRPDNGDRRDPEALRRLVGGLRQDHDPGDIARSAGTLATRRYPLFRRDGAATTLTALAVMRDVRPDLPVSEQSALVHTALPWMRADFYGLMASINEPDIAEQAFDLAADLVNSDLPLPQLRDIADAAEHQLDTSHYGIRTKAAQLLRNTLLILFKKDPDAAHVLIDKMRGRLNYADMSFFRQIRLDLPPDVGSEVLASIEKAISRRVQADTRAAVFQSSHPHVSDLCLALAGYSVGTPRFIGGYWDTKTERRYNGWDSEIYFRGRSEFIADIPDAAIRTAKAEAWALFLLDSSVRKSGDGQELAGYFTPLIRSLGPDLRQRIKSVMQEALRQRDWENNTGYPKAVQHVLDLIEGPSA